MPAPAPAPTATATAAPGPAGSSESLADGESGKGTATPAQQIAAHLAQLQDARQNNDRRGVARVLHHLPALRRALHAALLLELCALPCVAGCLDGMDGVAQALQALQAQTATDAAQAGDTASALAGVSAEQSVERTAYALLLVAVLLLDRQQWAASAHAAHRAVTLLLAPAQASRTVHDALLARCLFYLARAHECGTGGSAPDALHPVLMDALRLAALRHLVETEATAHNLVLRMHVLRSNDAGAAAFLAAAPFPQGATAPGNAQLARHHYYRARVLAAQGEYAGAARDIEQAVRRAPLARAAHGFRLATARLRIVVQLLRGEVPELAAFAAAPAGLRAYRALSNTVRLGDLGQFGAVRAAGQARWDADGLAPLVARLHETVLRAGMRRLALAYAQISYADIARKLGLASAADAAALVRQTLAEGIVAGEAVDEGPAGFFRSSAVRGRALFLTPAPQDALNARARALQGLHDDAVRAMRFPDMARAPSDAPADDLVRPSDADLLDDFMDMEDEMF